MAYQFTEEKHPSIDAIHARMGLLYPYTGSGADSVFRVCQFSTTSALAYIEGAPHAAHAFARVVGMFVPAVTDWAEISCEDARLDFCEMLDHCRWWVVGSGPSARHHVALTAEDSGAIADQILSLFPAPARFFRPRGADFCTQGVKSASYWGIGAVIAIHGSRIGVLWMQGWD